VLAPASGSFSISSANVAFSITPNPAPNSTMLTKISAGEPSHSIAAMPSADTISAGMSSLA
jgi:hypothetical protein